MIFPSYSTLLSKWLVTMVGKSTGCIQWDGLFLPLWGFKDFLQKKTLKKKRSTTLLQNLIYYIVKITYHWPIILCWNYHLEPKLPCVAIDIGIDCDTQNTKNKMVLSLRALRWFYHDVYIYNCINTCIIMYIKKNTFTTDSDRSSAMIKLKSHKTINITILFMMYNYDCPSNSVQSI